MNDLGRANGLLEIGLRSFERQAPARVDVSSRDGVGVTIVTFPRSRHRAPVIPRMLGTMPPSRTGSSPLQRCSQPPWAAPRSEVARTG